MAKHDTPTPHPTTAFEELQNVVAHLLDPVTGCPWDLKQTHTSLLPFLIEESYEFIHAVEENNPAHMKEELGDVLLQVLLHAGKGEQAHTFTFDEVCQGLKDKLVTRHPHVFEEKVDMTSDEVLVNWKKIKEKESLDKGVQKSPYSFSEKDLMNTGLMSAKTIGDKSTKLAFDWDHYSQVMYKVEEEWQELKEELPPGDQFNRERVQEELGDMLFSLVQLSRHLKINPETAIKAANKKFIDRFTEMEKILQGQKVQLKEMTEEQKEHYWNQAKTLLKKQP